MRSGLSDFLERMCNIFYEGVRPLVIHIPHLENLTELCSIIKCEFLEDRCAADPDQYSGFMSMGNTLLGDVTEKLVFRAHTYATTDILGYSPAPGDLAYPDKLIMIQEIARQQSTSKDGKEGGHSAADLHGLWYPSVRRTVLTLSKLYRCLDLEVFQGLAQDILDMCVQSLHQAQQKIQETKKPLDAQLFLVKHLLILREQTAPFRGNLAQKETSLDFSKFKDSAMALLTQRNRIFALNSNNSLLELITQVPVANEHRIDGRRVLDARLREACQLLISVASAGVVHELEDWLSKADVVRSMSADAKAPTRLSTQPFAMPQGFHTILSQAYRKLKDQVPKLRQSLTLYIGNRDTENILFAPIRKNLEQAFEKAVDLVAKEYTAEEAQVINAPSVHQISLILTAPPPPLPAPTPSSTTSTPAPPTTAPTPPPTTPTLAAASVPPVAPPQAIPPESQPLIPTQAPKTAEEVTLPNESVCAPVSERAETSTQKAQGPEPPTLDQKADAI